LLRKQPAAGGYAGFFIYWSASAPPLTCMGFNPALQVFFYGHIFRECPRIAMVTASARFAAPSFVNAARVCRFTASNEMSGCFNILRHAHGIPPMPLDILRHPHRISSMPPDIRGQLCRLSPMSQNCRIYHGGVVRT